MKQLLLLLLLTIMLMINAQAQRFTTFNSGDAFTAITVDGFNKKVWAGTTQNGVFNIDVTDSNSIPTSFSLVDPGASILSNIRIKSMAADKEGNVWVGHEGTNFSGSQGPMERIKLINNTVSVKHYSADRNLVGLFYSQRDGLANRKITSVCVDKNNRVWAAHKYHTLTSGSNFWVQPGALSYKNLGDPRFTTKGGWYNTTSITLAIHPQELPYPAYTYNAPISVTPQSRIMDAISCDDRQVWVGVRGYLKRGVNNSTDAGYQEPMLLNYRISDASFYQGFTYSQMGFPTGGVIYGVCANNAKGVWVTNSLAGRGFAVRKGGVWQYMDRNTVDADGGLFSNLIPENTRFNQNAIWKDKIGRVFMGTDKGLIVYNGRGDVAKTSSYKIYTKTDFGAATGNVLNEHEPTMLTDNIVAGSADPNNPSLSWIATSTGIMKLFLPIEGTSIYHIDDYWAYYSELSDGVENKRYMLDLKNELIPENGNADPEDIVSIAADGSHATLFRIDDFNPEGFYGTNPIYKLYVGPGPVSDIDQPGYIERYGHFDSKTITDYEGSPTAADQLNYVDFIYTHPKYIENYAQDENYEQLDFKIVDVTDSVNPNNLFRTPVKIIVPPILLGHGVWTSIKSLENLETYFLSKGFPDYALIKAWRTIEEKDDFLPENSFERDSWVIPTYIKDLKAKSAANLVSVGKVNVIVHSRGGLYTRGYIEGIDLRHPYKKDINSLITIDTPHFGSQGGNIALDRRVIVYKETIENTFIAISALTHIPLNVLIEADDITLGYIASLASVPKRDNPRNGSGGENWGARNLIVEDDNISGVVPPEDPGFISKLNSVYYLSQLEGTPIHTISAIVDPCIDDSILCLDALGVLSEGNPRTALLVLTIKNMLPDSMSEGLRSVTQALFNNEQNDFIVPLISMQGGLGDTRFNTPFGFTDNLDHTGMFREGVTDALVVHDKLLFLLKSKVYDETNNGFFTQTGLIHSEATYNFLENQLDAIQTRNTSFDAKILINKDPAIFDNLVEGDVINFNVYQEDVDRIMVTYQNVNDPDHFAYTTKIENLVFENAFSYTIPAGYSGELKITAYGFKHEVVGYAINTVTLNVGIPASVTLQGIHFAQTEPTILNQNSYLYRVIGTYSDGIDRELNNADITFAIEETAIISQVDNSTIKGEAVGSTLLTATIGGFEDTILIKVIENPTLQQTILTSFYGIPNTDNTAIAVNWETLREYENATFVLETSYGTPDNFTEVNQQAGNGTLNTPAQFNFEDTTFGANTLIYYRIKMIDTSSNVTYSSIIEVNLSTLGVEGENLSSLNLELYPNPAKTNEVTLKLDSKFTDKNAKLSLYSLQGKQLSVQILNVIEGTNNFKLKIGEGLTNGIYLVRVTTTNYIKTVKLIVEK